MHNSSSVTYTNPPIKHALAYISFRKIKGTSLQIISLIIPPTTAEITPNNIAIGKIISLSNAFCIPRTVNTEIPIVSNKNIVFLNLDK